MRSRIWQVGALAVVIPLAAVFASEPAATLAPQGVMQELKNGNQRFVTGKATHPRADRERIAETSKGQHPSVTVLTCADSRVPVEMIFDQGIGDVFVIRVAGNVCGPSELGSLDYAIEHLHTPLVVILGHEKCGAVTAVAQEGDLPGTLAPLSKRIKPAVEETRKTNPNLKDDALVRAAVRTNVNQAIADLLTRSDAAGKDVLAGKLMVVGAVYDIGTGEVEWLGPHPQEAKLARAGAAGKGPRHVSHTTGNAAP